MITDVMMVWRKDDPRQSALEAVIAAAAYYKTKYRLMPNFLNTPPGFLTPAEIEQLKQCWTVAQNAPIYFKNEIWLGVMTPAQQQAEA
jgi:hypothetical protein